MIGLRVCVEYGYETEEEEDVDGDSLDEEEGDAAELSAGERMIEDVVRQRA